MPRTIRIYVQAPSGKRFEADILADTKVSDLAVEFFGNQGWELKDKDNHGQRAVAELVHPHKPGETKRLNADQTVDEAGLRDGDVLRILPESIAGVVEHDVRRERLRDDLRGMQDLVKHNPKISFEAEGALPDVYHVTFKYPSFVRLERDDAEPQRGDSHIAKIILVAGYPNEAPVVTWQTDIFHPNIAPKEKGRQVCLGVLRERFTPGVGICQRLVHMLAEMLQWRNYDLYGVLDLQAGNWAAKPKNWSAIRAIGGYPFQGPVEKAIETIRLANRPKIEFRPVER